MQKTLPLSKIQSTKRSLREADSDLFLIPTTKFFLKKQIENRKKIKGFPLFDFISRFRIDLILEKQYLPASH